MRNLVNKTDKATAEIYLYGIIGSELDIDTNKLTAEIETLRKAGTSRFVFYVNSDGGEVVQGNSLFNYLDRTDIDVTWVVDGIAASMMAMLITNPKHTVRAARHAKFMYHRVQGYVYGNSAEVRAHADMIDTFEQSLIEMMAARMGVEPESVKTEFFTDGTDHWLSAQEAKKRGLVDEITSSGKRMKEADLSQLTNSRDVFNFYNNQIINIQKSKKMAEKNLYALALGLPQDEEESRVVNQIQNLVNEKKTLAASLEAEKAKVTELNNRLMAFEKAKVTNLINQAVADKKIGEDERQTYTALAEKDFDGVEKIINKLPGVTPVAGKLGKPGESDAWNKRREEISKSGK